MFTGIVQALGRIESHQLADSACRLVVDLSNLSSNTVQIGDSVAVNGACLTVTDLNQGKAAFDVSSESLAKTNIGDWQAGQQVNLELALTLNTPLGGHLVTGHVDGLGQLEERAAQDDAAQMNFRIPAALAKFVAAKGSICIDGVSLTSNSLIVDKPEYSIFTLTLVPHTLAATTLGLLQAGDSVHLEIDVIARYLDRMRDYENQIS